MIYKFLTAICLMTMLTLAGCGDAKKTDKTGKTGDDAKTSKTGDDAKTGEMKTEDKPEAQKTKPMPEGGDPLPMPVPEIDPLENTDNPPNQESGSAENNDGPQLNKE